AEGPAARRGGLGDLREGGAGRMRVGGVAQVEVGIEVDDTDARRVLAAALEMRGQALPGAEGDLVAATEHEREMAAAEDRGERARQARLRRLELAVGAHHVAGVVGRSAAVPGQAGERLADRR